MLDQNAFEARVEAYFRHRLGYQAPKVTQARTLAGGISRQTMGIWFEHGPASARNKTAMILRLDPDVSLLASNRHVEFAMFQAFRASGAVPVPRGICVEDDAAHLGATFLATELLEGSASIPDIIKPAFQAAGPTIAKHAFEILAMIAKFDWRAHGLGDVLATTRPETAWSDALDHWEAMLARHSLGPAPVVRMAIRTLRRDPPPPPSTIGIVHGDYRLGNILYTEQGKITGILDWEMAHLGDPLEDLAWALDPKWRPSGVPDKVFAHISVADAIAFYEQAKGEAVDRKALRWWSIFGRVKSAILWISAGHGFATQEATEMIQCMIAWNWLPRENLALLQELGRTGQ